MPLQRRHNLQSLIHSPVDEQGVGVPFVVALLQTAAHHLVLVEAMQGDQLVGPHGCLDHSLIHLIVVFV